MNKFIWTTTVLALFHLLSIGVSIVHAEVDGFRGMKWGATLSEIQQTKILVLTKDNGEQGSALYSVENELLEYGEAKLTGMHCSFVKGKLHSVLLLTKGAKDFSALKAEAFAEYGPTKGDNQANEELYNWTKDASNIVLSYNKDSQEGLLFLKQRDNQQPQQPPQVAATPSPPAQDVGKAPVPQQSEPPAEVLSPEIQRRIAIDLELTRLCWDGVGRDADTACRHMRDNVQILTELGMCMTPRDPNVPGPDILWSRCQPQAPTKSAGEDTNKDAVCLLIGGMFESAAKLRNEGAPPETAEMVLTSYQIEWAPEITEERIRETVNLVYFNPDFAQSWGRPLHKQMYNRCMTQKEARPLPPR